jgi:cardiolipin synthase
VRWLPNILTLARLPLAAGVVWSILGGRYGLALLLLAIAGLSDSLDGYLARRLGATSRFGTLIDPVADKVLLVSTFLTLGLAGLLPMWLVWMKPKRN